MPGGISGIALDFERSTHAVPIRCGRRILALGTLTLEGLRI